MTTVQATIDLGSGHVLYVIVAILLGVAVVVLGRR
jgi:hypothetical protein